jgi:heme/copper-type cytochrome/quinol oxidase subunit 2
MLPVKILEGEAQMKNMLLTILRLITLFIVYLVLFIVSSRVNNPPELQSMFTPEQLNQAAIALPIVSLIMSLMLSYLALRSRWHGWKLAGALFLIFYVLYTFLGWVELLAFPAVSDQMPKGFLTPGMLIEGLMLGSLVLGIPFSLLAVWILDKTKKESVEDGPNDRLRMSTFEWIWKLASAAILYVLVYFTFGYFVAWRTPGLPQFYGGTDPGTFLGQLANVMRGTPWLYALQIGRGLIWAGIGCIIIRMHKGKSWEVIVATGMSFTVLMNASLLFPNPFFPPFVAHAHMIELVSSNFLYGILLSVLMLWTPIKQMRTIRTAHPTD